MTCFHLWRDDADGECRCQFCRLTAPRAGEGIFPPPTALDRRERLVARMMGEAHARAVDPKNVAKGDGWSAVPLADLIRLLRAEVDELAEAVLSGAPDEHIRAEVGDVAWMAAIVGDAARAMGGDR